jgi:carboxyl-terminal processing protease
MNKKKKMTSKKVKFLILTVLVAASLFLLLERNFLPGLSSKDSGYKRYTLLAKVANLIQNEYVDKPNPSKTMEGAFKGLVDSLDTLSTYLDKESVARYRQRKEEDIKDPGIILFKKFGLFPQVVGIIESSPAEKMGIKIGDYISAMDGRSTLMMSLIEANLYLRAKNETPIDLKVLRSHSAEDATVLKVPRKQLFKERFSYSPVKGTSGILKIHKLYPDCVNRIKEKALPRLKQQKDPLILDLRNCYEGEIEEAQKLINLFMKSPKIGYFEKKGKAKDILSCKQKPELEKLPLIIWTNQATIGPAEAVASVLKEFRKAKIIGLQTVGLIAREQFFTFEDGSGLLLTSGVFTLGSGKKLWEKGVKPDIKIKMRTQSQPEYLKKTFNILSKI